MDNPILTIFGLENQNEIPYTLLENMSVSGQIFDETARLRRKP